MEKISGWLEHIFEAERQRLLTEGKIERIVKPTGNVNGENRQQTS